MPISYNNVDRGNELFNKHMIEIYKIPSISDEPTFRAFVSQSHFLDR